jgi:hypothetical protein
MMVLLSVSARPAAVRRPARHPYRRRPRRRVACAGRPARAGPPDRRAPAAPDRDRGRAWVPDGAARIGCSCGSCAAGRACRLARRACANSVPAGPWWSCFCGGRCGRREVVSVGEPLRRVAAGRACDVGRALRAFAATSDERAQRGFAQKVPSHAALVRSIELDRCAGRASLRRNARATCRNHRVPSPRSGLFVGVFLSLSLGGSRCIAASACVTSR